MYGAFDLNNKKSNIDITTKSEETVRRDIQKINYRRIKIFSYVVLLFELLLILFYDIPRILENSDQLIYKVYFGLHIALLFISLIALFLLYHQEKNPEQEMPKYFVEGIVFLFMFFMALVGFLDLVRSDQIISYISMLTIAGITVLIEPPRNYLVYTIPHSLFLFLSFYFIEDRNFFMGNLINTTMYFVCILILSRIVYENQFSHIVKNIALMEANRELAYLSNHDPLTKISNRRYFETRIKDKYLTLEDTQAVLTMIDLDDFKNINDQYGHSVGDIVLEEIVAIINANIREVDLFARWGGEEFVILFTNLSLDQAKEIVERIRIAIASEKLSVRGNKISITASFGMCKFKSHTETAMNNSYIKADRLLYQAKANGRNRIEIG